MSVTDNQHDPGEPPAPQRRRAPKGEMRRAALLDAAIEVISKDGYQNASMRDVARIAGISTVGLLHHFPNKVALLQAVLDRRDQRVVERFGQLQTEPTLDGFMQFLRMSMGFSVEDASECQAALMINIESLSDKHPAFPWHQEKFELVHSHAQAHLTSLIDSGAIRANVDVKAMALELFSVMDGLQIQWLRGRESVDVMQVFDVYLSRLANDLKPVEQAHP
jgi:AcrR family transcriptional regulator